MIQNTLEETKKSVWPKIEKYLKEPDYPRQFTIPQKFSKDVDLYWKINKEYPERKGKYLRPTLVVLTAKALGVDSKKSSPVAAAMQLSEEWILISDDIEDQSIERRGKPTLHKMYSNHLAMNASDCLETVMWKMVSDINSKAITEEFYRLLMRTVLGQSVELFWTEGKSKKLTPERYFFFADSKSAYYSIAGPMRLGAILAGASPKELDKISEFGLHLGRCFQLVDDILDVNQDKKEGKLTLANLNGIPYTKKLAVKESKIARKIFDTELQFLSKEPARTQLKELIDFILERKY